MPHNSAHFIEIPELIYFALQYFRAIEFIDTQYRFLT
jgi:hypothetical protein